MTDLTEPRFSTFGDEHEHVLSSGVTITHSHGGPASDVPLYAHPVAYSIAHPPTPVTSLNEAQAQSLWAKVSAWLRR